MKEKVNSLFKRKVFNMSKILVVIINKQCYNKTIKYIGGSKDREINRCRTADYAVYLGI